jgi:hypothetical protein
MNRRTFVASSLAAVAAASVEPALGQRGRQTGREYYELRTLTFQSPAARERYGQYVKDAFLPAAKRIGLGAVGGFTVEGKPDDLTLLVLTSSPSLDGLMGVEHRLLSDADYQKAAAQVLDLPATDPPYAKMESSLMLAFSGHPRTTLPKESAANQPRIFELRIYESHSKKANLKKIEMFNEGETAIFERAGFQPVFLAETLTGPQVPNLTYMVTYPAMSDREKFWKAFLADPEKARLFAIPEYSDKLIVSKIRSVFLRPTAWSQI